MKIICLGDSITRGQFSYNWVKDLSIAFRDYSFINEGMNGALAYNRLKRVEGIQKHKPDVVFILLGTNDILSITSKTNTRRYMRNARLPEVPTKDWFVKNLETIISAIQPTNTKIALITIPLLGEEIGHFANKLVREYNQAIISLQEKYSCDLIDLHSSMVDYLEENPPKKPIPFDLSLNLIFKAILKRIFFFYSWNRISRSFGLTLTTDTIHLNDTSGQMLAELTREYIRALGNR